MAVAGAVTGLATIYMARYSGKLLKSNDALVKANESLVDLNKTSVELNEQLVLANKLVADLAKATADNQNVAIKRGLAHRFRTI